MDRTPHNRTRIGPETSISPCITLTEFADVNHSGPDCRRRERRLPDPGWTARALGCNAFTALALFVIGWILQFIGHAFEGKPPEFFSDWRFLFVGVRWWWAKINGKA